VSVGIDLRLNHLNFSLLHLHFLLAFVTTIHDDDGGDFALAAYLEQVAQLSPRDRATHELLRFAKLRSGLFEPPFWGLRGNVGTSCVRRWKKRGRLPIGDNCTF